MAENNLKLMLERLGLWQHVMDVIAMQCVINDNHKEFLVDLGRWSGSGWNKPIRGTSRDPSDGGYFDDVYVHQRWIEDVLTRAVSYGMSTDFYDEINYRLSEERMNEDPR